MYFWLWGRLQLCGVNGMDSKCPPCVEVKEEEEEEEEEGEEEKKEQ